MRLLLINYEFPPLGGGAGNATANIARELAVLGHDTHVLTSAFGDLPRDQTIDGYHVHRVRTLRRAADRCTALEMLVYMSSASTAVTFTACGRDWDGIIAFFGIPSGPVAYLASRRSRGPFIVSLRGADVPGHQPEQLRRQHQLAGPVIRFLWKRAAAVVANSAGLADTATRFAPDIPVAIVPNGVDTSFFAPSVKPLRTPQMLYVGRLSQEKGVDCLLQAVAKLEGDWQLGIVGDGPERPALEAMADDRVRFLGWQDKAKLRQRYQEASIFVLPSRYEGMANVVLEAMASGLPVVATTVGGNAELIVPGETGWLVPPDDPDAMAHALRPLLRDSELRIRCGRAGRARVEQQFGWRAVAKAYVDLMKPLNELNDE
ncbi:MAG: glycogen(starch) synthase [Rhodothermales bacterium]|jgi:glycogen(starch) synthase